MSTEPELKDELSAELCKLVEETGKTELEAELKEEFALDVALELKLGNWLT